MSGGEPVMASRGGGHAGGLRVVVEVGAKRAFVAALDWPGWCRGGRDEAGAIGALLAYRPRYAKVAASAGQPLAEHGAAPAVDVLERLAGGPSTDFGTPGAVAADERRPLEEPDLGRLMALYAACWGAFDAAVAAARASGGALAGGARGGGRSLARIVAHVLEAEEAYLARIGWKAPPGPPDAGARSAALRPVIRDALATVAPVGQPEPGPRGGARWPARYFIRRDAWHLLDHAWEIEDRTGP